MTKTQTLEEFKASSRCAEVAVVLDTETIMTVNFVDS